VIIEDRTGTDPTHEELRSTLDGLFVGSLTLAGLFMDASWRAIQRPRRFGWLKSAVCALVATACMDRAEWAVRFRTRFDGDA
jgi:hypothetical protein